MGRPPLVLVDVIRVCEGCDEEVRIVTDGLSAHAEGIGAPGWDEEGGTRTGTIVEVLCPHQDRLYGRDSETRCHEVIAVDLSEEGVWSAATTDALSRLSLAGRLDG